MRSRSRTGGGTCWWGCWWCVSRCGHSPSVVAALGHVGRWGGGGGGGGWSCGRGVACIARAFSCPRRASDILSRFGWGGGRRWQAKRSRERVRGKGGSRGDVRRRCNQRAPSVSERDESSPQRPQRQHSGYGEEDSPRRAGRCRVCLARNDLSPGRRSVSLVRNGFSLLGNGFSLLCCRFSLVWSDSARVRRSVCLLRNDSSRVRKNFCLWRNRFSPATRATPAARNGVPPFVRGFLFGPRPISLAACCCATARPEDSPDQA